MWKRACRFIRLHLSLALVLSHLIFFTLPLFRCCFLQFLSTSFPLTIPVHRRDSPEVADNPSQGAVSLLCYRKTRWREHCQRSLSTLQIPVASEASQPLSSLSSLLCVCVCFFFSYSFEFSFIMQTPCFSLVNVADSTSNRKHCGSQIRLHVQMLNRSAD